MKKLKTQKFIEAHPDWEARLSAPPYSLRITREKWNGRNLLMLKYSMVGDFPSDFNEPICRECRGLILDEDDMSRVSVPFYKFGNVNEGDWVEKIDWDDDPYVLEKCDGSLIKVVKTGGKLLVSTNGTILASSAPVADQIGCESKTFEELFYWALREQFSQFSKEWLESLFEEGFTYMFELCTPFNRVVVRHDVPKVYFIGVRNNETLEETYIMDHPLSGTFPTPKVYRFGSLDECIKSAEALSWDAEGYVVTDRSFKRNKVKSLQYLMCHHMKNNGVLSHARGVDLVRRNEIAEVVAYFPEFKEHLEKIETEYRRLIGDLEVSWTAYRLGERNGLFKTRKDSALWILKNFRIPSIGFLLLDGKISSPREWIDSRPSDYVVNMLGFKNGAVRI